MGVSIRPAAPRDAAFLAWTMLTASRSHLSRGAWDLYVDAVEPRVLALLARLATQPEPSFCRWEHFLVAEVDGEPSAALAAYAGGEPLLRDPGAAMTAASRDALGWDDAARLAGDARLAGFLTCAVAPSPSAWAIEWVAAVPAARRRGLVQRLLDVACETGRARGYRESELAILIGNVAAERAYERAGYRVVDELRHPDFERALGCPGTARMVRAL